MPDDKPFGLGLIGCGSFGEFCLDAFSTMDLVRVAAVADVNEAAARRLGAKFRVPAHGEAMDLIRREDVEIVHVATPPSSHHELVMAAVAAGKHVLCEKPLATRLAHADEMLAAACDAGVIVPVDFVLRYNAVTDAVRAVIDSGVLGKVLAGRLTNCAKDSKLGADHWFWDKSVSGGIFIEHGAHFFDLYTYWLGEGEVLDAHTETRRDAAQAAQMGSRGGLALGAGQGPRLRSGQEDRVQCTIRFAGGAVAHHYHGFDQVHLMDRTDHRLVCELGDLRVNGWIPLSLEIDALVSDETQGQLEAACPHAGIEVLASYEGADRTPTGRGVRRNVARRIRLTWEPAADKQSVYADSLRALLADQIAYLRDPSHCRRITEANGRAALALGEKAAKLAAMNQPR